ncbi:hypothetical protein SAMN05444161_1378 [Rhizobiales bacterium GAS191]|nr:hypothetical protein SAMN05519103_00490 [Rhizobiales bacterium GAS113]SEC56331.1 hypothetical protein SAMN05444161_1378 [Rhizobiales bacterium GAS191]
MLTKAQMKYATERLAEIPETDREPVLDALRAELPRHEQVSDEEFRSALQCALDCETSGKCDDQGVIPKLRPDLPINEVADTCRRLSHSSPAPLPPERQARLDEREALLRAEFDKLAPEEKLCWQRSVFSKDAAELSTNPIVRAGTYIAWKIFKETGRPPGVKRNGPPA